MSARINFLNEYGSIVSAVLYAELEQAQFELRRLVSNYEARGWMLTGDIYGNYDAEPPAGAPLSSYFRKIVIVPG